MVNGEHTRPGPSRVWCPASRRTQDFGSPAQRRDVFDGTSKTAREDACAPRRVATINDQQPRQSTNLFLRQPLDVEVHHFAEVELSVHLRFWADVL